MNQTTQKKHTAVKVLIIIISLMVMIIAVGGLANNYAKVQQASKDVDTSCQVLKNRTIELRDALKEVENTGSATPAQMSSVSNSIQNYNDQCGSRTGVI